MSVLIYLAIFAVGVIAFFAAAEVLWGPKPVKPKPVTMADVWATIASAQKTVDESLALIGRRPPSTPPGSRATQ